MQDGPFMIASISLGEMGSYGKYFIIQIISDMMSALFICYVLKWNWYSFSDALTFAGLFDLVLGFFLADLVMAKIMTSVKQPIVS